MLPNPAGPQRDFLPILFGTSVHFCGLPPLGGVNTGSFSFPYRRSISGVVSKFLPRKKTVARIVPVRSLSVSSGVAGGYAFTRKPKACIGICKVPQKR